MKMAGQSVLTTVVLLALVTTGCGHKLVAAKGQHSARVFDSVEIYQAYQKIMEARSKPLNQMTALLGQMIEFRESVEVDEGTQVKVLSRTEAGAQVEILEGPSKGYKGFVPKENLD